MFQVDFYIYLLSSNRVDHCFRNSPEQTPYTRTLHRLSDVLSLVVTVKYLPEHPFRILTVVPEYRLSLDSHLVPDVLPAASPIYTDIFTYCSENIGTENKKIK